MADQPVVHIGENSPEQVALNLHFSQPIAGLTSGKAKTGFCRAAELAFQTHCFSPRHGTLSPPAGVAARREGLPPEPAARMLGEAVMLLTPV